MNFLSAPFIWNSLIASLLAVLVGLLGQTAWLRRRPAMMHLLWLVVLAKFITPAFIPLPVLPAPREVVQATHEVATPPVAPTFNLTQEIAEQSPELDTPPAATPPTSEPLFATAAVATPNPRWAILTAMEGLTWGASLLAISLCGTAWIVLRSAYDIVRFQRWLRESSGTSERLSRLLEACRQRMTCRSGPAVRVLYARCSPFLWTGPRRSCIYVPQTMVDRLDEDQLRSVLCHELAHHVRRDTWANLFAYAVTTVCWWNPLVWRARRALREVQELCCDALVLARLDLPRRAYAETLLTTLDFVDGALVPPSALASSWGGVSSLKVRFQMIGDSQVIPRTSTSFALLTSLLALVLLCFPVQGQQAADPEPNPVAAALEPAPAAEPTPKAAARAAALKENVKNFVLRLTYRGPQDKPYYDLLLSVPKLEPAGAQPNPFHLEVNINEAEASKLIDYLASEGYLDRALDGNRDRSPSPPPEPYYSLIVHAKDGPNVIEWLAWDLKMLTRLDGLKEVLAGDAAKAMDQLLGRLSGHRREWEQQAAAQPGQLIAPQWGDAVDGLRMRLSTPKQTFRAGEPIDIKLELENVSDQDRQYGHHHFIRSGSEIQVTDEHGQRVPYFGGGAGLKQTLVTLKKSETKEIEACDLSSFYYLRRPGRYSVEFRAAGLPSSNRLDFVVSGDAAAADGDPMGRLLPSVSEKWTLVGSPNRADKIRPGHNRGETPGWQFIYVDAAKGFKGSKAAVWLWLTDEPAEETAPAENGYPPASEYLGKISRWHAYLHATPEALEIWPEVKDDLRTALEKKPDLAADPAWGKPENGLRTRLSTPKQTFLAGEPIDIKLELENVSDQDRQYGHHHFIRSGSEIQVTDEHGQRVPYLGGGAGLPKAQVTLKQAETKVIEACDLSSFYYLRRPGLYTVAYHSVAVYAAGVPSSNAVRFQVVAEAGPAADGDPMGRLLPRVSPEWTLVGSPNRADKIRPGNNRTEMPGWQFIYVDAAKGLKGSKAAVWLWLTDEPAEETAPAENGYPPASEYLGKISRWHAYLHATPEALKTWPLVKDDLKTILNEKVAATNTADGAASDEDYRLLHDRYKALVQAALKANPDDDLQKPTDQFNTALGGKLLYVQVVARGGPIAEHKTLLSRFFDESRKVAIGKLNFAAAEKPIVSQNHFSQGCVLVATNPLGNQKWPDDLQITLVMDNATKEDVKQATASAPRPEATTLRGKWSAPSDGLQIAFAASQKSFRAGQPVPLSLWVKNVADEPKMIGFPSELNHSVLRVVDERGQEAPYLHGMIEDRLPNEKLSAGADRSIKSFDLAEFYYLRRPGRYTVRWIGESVTAELDFVVTADAASSAADGDPVGRLLPLVKPEWWLSAGSNRQGQPQPGDGRDPNAKWFMSVQKRSPDYQLDFPLVWLQLADQPVAPPDRNSSLPTYEYVGKIARWHVYMIVTAAGEKDWPTAKEDIRQALAEAGQQRVGTRTGQIQQSLQPAGLKQIHPSMLQNPLWLELEQRLAKSGLQYRVVEVDENGKRRLSLATMAIRDLTPLKGMLLESLDLSYTAVDDLAPLAGMPLTWLDLDGTQVQSLAPLKGMPLTTLSASSTRVADLAPLAGAKLKSLVATSTPIADLKPLEGMPIAYLDLRRTRVTDLAPLARMPLATLQIEDCAVKDFGPLAKTSLTTLTLSWTQGLVLEQLKTIPLKTLVLTGEEFADLSPLGGMQLESLRLIDTGVTDISMLANMPLRSLGLQGTTITDLSPLRGTKLTELYLPDTALDLSPLADLPLENIGLPDAAKLANIDVLRNIKSLKTIRPPQSKPLPVAEFWRHFDELRKAAAPARQPDLQSALKYVREHYNTPVDEIDGQTIGVIWESGAEAKFEALKAKLKGDFGVDAKITAIE